MYLLKDIHLIGAKKFLLLKNKKYCNLNGEEIVVRFYEKELRKTNQKEFRIEKVI